MKKWIFCLIAFACALPTYAADCAQIKERIHKLEDLRRHGGSLKQMEHWRLQSDELATKLSRCSEHPIRVASGAITPSNRNSRTSLARLRTVDAASAPQVQKLLATCNYWIAEYNNKASPTNASFRDTACRALDERLRNTEAPSPNSTSALKNLSECIKPNNLIDSEVQECRQGLRAPVWNKH